MLSQVTAANEYCGHLSIDFDDKCFHLPIHFVICLVILLPNVKMSEISEILITSSETCNGRKISGTVLKF